MVSAPVDAGTLVLLQCEIAANQDFYLTRLPLTGAVATQFSTWVEAAIAGEHAVQVQLVAWRRAIPATGIEDAGGKANAVGVDMQPPMRSAAR